MSDTAAPHPEMGQKLQEVITDLNRQYVDAFKRGDTATVAALYAEDATLMPPHQDLVSGRAAIQQFLAEDVLEQLGRGGVAEEPGQRLSTSPEQVGVRDLTLEPVDVGSDGNLGYEMGRYQVTEKPAGGQPVADAGTYLTVWKRQRGEWRIAYDTFNSSLPPPS